MDDKDFALDYWVVAGAIRIALERLSNHFHEIEIDLMGWELVMALEEVYRFNWKNTLLDM